MLGRGSWLQRIGVAIARQGQLRIMKLLGRDPDSFALELGLFLKRMRLRKLVARRGVVGLLQAILLLKLQLPALKTRALNLISQETYHIKIPYTAKSINLS